MISRRLMLGKGYASPQPDGTLTIGSISTVTNDTKYNAIVRDGPLRMLYLTGSYTGAETAFDLGIVGVR